jgi:hypothetical protein
MSDEYPLCFAELVVDPKGQASGAVSRRHLGYVSNP